MRPFPFTAIVEQETAKQALMIMAVNLQAVGLLVAGAPGTAQSSLMGAMHCHLGELSATGILRVVKQAKKEVNYEV